VQNQHRALSARAPREAPEGRAVAQRVPSHAPSGAGAPSDFWACLIRRAQAAAVEEAKKLPGDGLSSFLDDISDFTPTIPPAVIEYYLMRSGFKPSDERM